MFATCSPCACQIALTDWNCATCRRAQQSLLATFFLSLQEAELIDVFCFGLNPQLPLVPMLQQRQFSQPVPKSLGRLEVKLVLTVQTKLQRSLWWWWETRAFFFLRSNSKCKYFLPQEKPNPWHAGRSAKTINFTIYISPRTEAVSKLILKH